MPVHIVHLITGLGSGGAESMLTRLATGSRDPRVRHSIVSMLDDGMQGETIRRAGVTLHTLNMLRGRASPRGFVKLVRLLRSLRPDVIQTWLYHADFAGLLAARLAGVPRLCWNLRGAETNMSQYSRQSRWLRRGLARLSAMPDAVLVNSRAGRRENEALGYRPRRWVYIPNGFDPDHFRPNPEARTDIRDELGLTDGHVAVGLVARYDPVKDHATFLAAAQAVAKADGQVRFVLVGRGITWENYELAAAIRGRNLGERLHLLGERRDVARILAGLDIAALSSIGEGFPNVLGEAMACGVPCVSTDVGDAALLLGDTGMVVPPGDDKALAAAISRLVEAGPETRRRIGGAARMRIHQKFSLAGIIGEYERFYLELVAERKESHDAEVPPKHSENRA